MYDKNSDYALNKRSRNSIVCKSVTGEHIHIRREDFSSDEEFERWKAWSDADYHAAERGDKAFNDRKRAFSYNWEPASEDSEVQLLSSLERCEDAEKMRLLRSQLTNRQFTRLYKRFGLGMSVTSIATEENVSKAAVIASINSAQDTLHKVACNDNSADC